MTPLEKFLNTYSYYIKKLLWINADPYLTKKHEQFLSRLEEQSGGTTKEERFYANVFNRLEHDVRSRKKKEKEE